MPLVASGTLSANNIQVELGRASGSNMNLQSAETGGYGSINRNWQFFPNGTSPHSISEWYSYNHWVTSGVRLLYDFTNPSCYNGTGSTVYDLSGNGYNGTIYGNISWQTTPQRHFRFVAGLLRIGNVGITTGDYTVAMWVRLRIPPSKTEVGTSVDASNQNQMFVTSGDNNFFDGSNADTWNSNKYTYPGYMIGYRYRPYVRGGYAVTGWGSSISASGNYRDVHMGGRVSPAVRDYTWSFFCYKRVGNTVTTYRDGELLCVETDANSSGHSLNNVLIGRSVMYGGASNPEASYGETYGYMCMDLGQVAIWDRALSNAEVMQQFTSTRRTYLPWMLTVSQPRDYEFNTNYTNAGTSTNGYQITDQGNNNSNLYSTTGGELVQSGYGDIRLTYGQGGDLNINGNTWRTMAIKYRNINISDQNSANHPALFFFKDNTGGDMYGGADYYQQEGYYVLRYSSMYSITWYDPGFSNSAWNNYAQIRKIGLVWPF